MDIFSLVILFFVISTVTRLIKKISATSKQNQAQAQQQAETAKSGYAPKPAPKPVPKQEDFRFPTIQRPAPQPLSQEGRDPNAKMTEYTSIAPSTDLNNQFTEYQGSLGASTTEGTGYKTEAYDPIDTAYQAEQEVAVHVLPEVFNLNALLQAVVMSEILKRPEAAQ